MIKIFSKYSLLADYNFYYILQYLFLFKLNFTPFLFLPFQTNIILILFPYIVISDINLKYVISLKIGTKNYIITTLTVFTIYLGKKKYIRNNK